MSLGQIQAGESCNVTATFKDMAGSAIVKSSLITLKATLYEQESGDVINSRNAQNVLDANGGTVSSAGVLTLRLGPLDSAIQDPTLDVGKRETHVLRLEWTWSDGVATRTGIAEETIEVERIEPISA